MDQALERLNDRFKVYRKRQWKFGFVCGLVSLVLANMVPPASSIAAGFLNLLQGAERMVASLFTAAWEGEEPDGLAWNANRVALVVTSYESEPFTIRIGEQQATVGPGETKVIPLLAGTVRDGRITVVFPPTLVPGSSMQEKAVPFLLPLLSADQKGLKLEVGHAPDGYTMGVGIQYPCIWDGTVCLRTAF